MCNLEFFSDIVKETGDILAKKYVFDYWDANNISDTIRMYIQTKQAEDIDEKWYINKIKIMHENLSKDYYKIKQKNRKIKYKKNDLNVNDIINGYTFCLAVDTASLVDCGRKLGICVGSYGDSASNKRCNIVFIIDKDKFVGCIELSSDMKRLVQAKAKYNNMIQEDYAIALKKWVEKTI